MGKLKINKFYSSRRNYNYLSAEWPWGESIVVIQKQCLAILKIMLMNDEPEFAYLSSLIVSEEYRKHGHATRILKHAINLCKRSGIKEIYLFCYTDSNAWLIDFYKKMGFTKIQERDETSIWMTMMVE